MHHIIYIKTYNNSCFIKSLAHFPIKIEISYTFVLLSDKVLHYTNETMSSIILCRPWLKIYI